jgi:hypothetical protein
MSKYKMQLDTNKAWDPTLDHFSKLFAQCKAYGNDRTANSGFENIAATYDVPSNPTIATTKSSGDFTSRGLYIESLKESLALARDYVTNAPRMASAPTPVVDPMATLCLDVEAQCKQFKLLLKQKIGPRHCVLEGSNLGSGTTPKPRRTGRNICGHTSRSAPTARRCAPTSRLIVSPWQRMQTNIPPTGRYPCQPDRSWGPTLILI